MIEFAGFWTMTVTTNITPHHLKCGGWGLLNDPARCCSTVDDCRWIVKIVQTHPNAESNELRKRLNWFGEISFNPIHGFSFLRHLNTHFFRCTMEQPQLGTHFTHRLNWLEIMIYSIDRIPNNETTEATAGYRSRPNDDLLLKADTTEPRLSQKTHPIPSPKTRGDCAMSSRVSGRKVFGN